MSTRLLFCGLLLIGAFQGSAEQTTLSVDNLLAGDNFDAQLDVTNNGSLDLNYALTTTITGNASLAQALMLSVRARTTNSCAARDGTVLWSGALADAALGNPAHGVQAGDRHLAPGSSEALCFTVELPDTAPATLHATAIGATFLFQAEQA